MREPDHIENNEQWSMTMVPTVRRFHRYFYRLRGKFFAAKKNNYEKILMNIFGKPIANLVTYVSLGS